MSQEKTDPKNVNSAIGSWSGYIFQGLCAIYVILKYISDELDDENKKITYKNYICYLDSYNDFSIHKENNIAVSLHQCKIYKYKNNFQDAQKQLLKQKEYLQRQLVCNNETKLFFHCNHKVDVINGIFQYEYEEGQFAYGHQEIVNGIKNLVTFLLKKSNIKRSVNSVCNALYELVETHVLEIHNESLKTKRNLRDIAREIKHAIPFDEIRDVLYSDPLKSCLEDEFWLLTKIYFVEALGEVFDQFETPEDWEDKNPSYIKNFIDSITVMSQEEFFKVIRRIIPTEKKENTSTTLINIVNKAAINGLFTIIGKTNQKLSKRIDWNDNNQFESPAFFSESSERIICRNLYKFGYNLDCLREYDWLVHNQNFPKIDDCWGYLKKITDISESRAKSGDKTDPSKNILREKKIGLLSVGDFNDRQYS